MHCNCRDKYVDVESEEEEDQDQVLVEEGHVGLDSCKRKIDTFLLVFHLFLMFSVERICLFITLLLACLCFPVLTMSNFSISMFGIYHYIKTSHMARATMDYKKVM